MLNNITIMGRIVHTPELRYTQANVPVCSFSVACERDFKENGEKVTDFIDCVAWRHTAEFIQKHFSKGGMIIVNGRLQLRDWTDKNGNKRRNAEINVEAAYFGEPKRKGDDEEHAPAPTDADAPPAVDMAQKQRDLAELEKQFSNVQFAAPDEPLPWEM